MSSIDMNKIWQHDLVLPYILGGLKQKIDTITPVQQIYLMGSRCRTPVNEWERLQGKDWDILVVCSFPIVNTGIWTTALNYHIDLIVTNHTKAPSLLRNAGTPVQLYPDYELSLNFEKPGGL
jgi:hypothetical protein